MPPPRKDLIALLEVRASYNERHDHLMVRTNQERCWAADYLLSDEKHITELETIKSALCEVNTSRATENIALHREVERLSGVRFSRVEPDDRYLAGINAGLRLAADAVRNAPPGISHKQLAEALLRMVREPA